MGLIIPAILVVVFTVNVTMGSISGTPPLSNVAEMIILFMASIAFVTDILKREARAKAEAEDATQSTREEH